MKNRNVVILLVVSNSFFGCASILQIEPLCQAPNGLYTMEFVEQAGGNCGPQNSEDIQIVDGKKSMPSICSDSYVTDQNDCHLATFTTTCVGSNITTKMHEDFTWATDTNSATSILSITMTTATTGAVMCSSIYNVTYQKKNSFDGGNQ